MRLFREAKLAHDEFGKYLRGFLRDYKSGEVVAGGDSALKALVEHSVEASGVEKGGTVTGQCKFFQMKN